MWKIVRLVLFFFGVFLFIGCASISNFNTAKPLGQSNAIGYLAVSHITTLGDTDVVLIEEMPDFTFFEFGGNVGLMQNLDIGMKYTFPTAGSMNGKYTFFGGEKEDGLFAAAGVNFGYTSFPTTAGDTTDNNRIEYFIPLYLSYYPTKSLGVTIIPSYSGRYFPENSSTYEHLAGGNINMRVGERWGFALEFAYFHNFGTEWDEVQFGGGVLFPIKGLPGWFGSNKAIM